MKCYNCGSEITPEMKFCGKCGKPLKPAEVPAGNAEISPASGPGKAKQKKYIIAAIVIVALIAAISLVLKLTGSPGSSLSENIIYLYQAEEQVLVQSPRKDIATLEGFLATYEYSLDKTKAAFIISEDEGSFHDDGGTLYIADTDGVKRVAEDVFRVDISSSGKSVAYIKDRDGDIGTLCLYKGGKTTTITADASMFASLVLSPDGNIVGYTVYDDDETTGCYYDGKQRILGSGIVPLAISDGAKFVYFSRNGKLYVQKGDNSGTRENYGEYNLIMGFNKDLSQIVFSAFTGNEHKTYLSQKGGEKIKLSGDINAFLLPSGTLRKGKILGIDSFAGAFCRSSDNICLIDDKFECKKVLSNVVNPQLAKDGKTIIYQKDDRVEKIDGTNENVKPTILVDEYVSEFVATDTGNAIYYLTFDDELYYLKGKNKPVLVDHDIDYGASEYRSLRYALYGGSTLFYITDDELHISTGRKGKVVDGIEGEVFNVYSDGNSVFVYSYDGTDLYIYRTLDGETFELLNRYYYW